ncbi:MAG: hypothetical protein Q4D58_05930 [Synergistaceae bacterium]|nr:hypothetical protein [Synergistaceae bacterium]
MKKLMPFCAALFIFLCPFCARADELGITLPVFLTQMGIAFDQVKWGFSQRGLSESLVQMPNGNFAAEYNEDIVLYLNMTAESNRLMNVALSFTVSEWREHERNRRSGLLDGEAQYESLCKQIILALDHRVTEKEVGALLEGLGLFGPVLDGRQRREISGRFIYMMRLYRNNIMFLATSSE